MIAIALRIDWMLIKKRSNVFRGSEKFTSRYHVGDVRTRLGSKLCPSAASRSGVNSFGLALEEISRALMGLFRSVRANGPNSIPNDSITGLAKDRDDSLWISSAWRTGSLPQCGLSTISAFVMDWKSAADRLSFPSPLI